MQQIDYRNIVKLTKKEKYDNLIEAFKALKGEKDPAKIFQAVSGIDDQEIKDTLLWHLGIEYFYTGWPAWNKEITITTPEIMAKYDNNQQYWFDKAMEEGCIHYDLVDELEERGFQLFLEEHGILIENKRGE